MIEFKYNVRNGYTILDHIDEYEPWALNDELGKLMQYCPEITSPDMLNATHFKQPIKTRELFLARREGKVPTVEVKQRRGYKAVVFTIA